MLEGLGWVTHWFYLPLALFIPTSQMIIHSEFNFIYQFLIHTELMGDLGILGNILNTASHHRVHHGANRYCLDKGLFLNDVNPQKGRWLAQKCFCNVKSVEWGQPFDLNITNF